MHVRRTFKIQITAQWNGTEVNTDLIWSDLDVCKQILRSACALKPNIHHVDSTFPYFFSSSPKFFVEHCCRVQHKVSAAPISGATVLR